MKKILSLALTLAAALAVHAQGTFFPGTYASDPNGTYAGGAVTDTTLSGTGPGGKALAFGTQYQAQYYIGAAGITDPFSSSLVAVGPKAGFLGANGGDKAGGAGFFEGNGNASISTSFAGGSTVSLMLWAWKGATGSTLAGSTINGHSQILQFVLGGAGSPPSSPSSVTSMANFGLVGTPEPATIALGLMGAGALFIRRRK